MAALLDRSRTDPSAVPRWLIPLAIVIASGNVASQCNPGGGGHGTDGGAGAAGASNTDASAGAAGAAGAAGTPAGGSAGTAGVAGTSGAAGTDGGAGTAGTDGASGSSGAAGVAGEAGSPASQFCGDGIRDPVTEECDDGVDNIDDSCDQGCEIRDLAAGPAVVPVDAGAPVAGRRLGTGRHPVAAGAGGFAVAREYEDQSDRRIELATYDAKGTPIEKALEVEASAILDANPVVAAIGGGKVAVAYTDFGADGDELGIALRVADQNTVGSLQHANAQTAFSQWDPDIVAVGSSVVVAWMDDADAATGPDVRIRTFNTSLVPQGNETSLAATADVEGNVALAPFDGSWAAAWRAGDQSGVESVHATAGGVDWWIAGVTGGPADDKPALAELDGSDLLLVYTETTDPLGTGVADVPRLRGAVLDVTQPGPVVPFDIAPMALLGPTIGQSQPDVVAAGDRVYVAWRSSAITGDAQAEDVWLARFDWVRGDGGPPTLTQQIEIPLPRWPEHLPGDQRRPALAATPLYPGGAIASAWEDYGKTFGTGEAGPDVVTELIPVPVVRLQGAAGGGGQ